MAEFTLLELHLDDASFTANAPLSGEDGAGGDEGESDLDVESAGEADDGRRVAPLLVGLAALVVLAIVVKKLRGGDTDGDGDVETAV